MFTAGVFVPSLLGVLNAVVSQLAFREKGRNGKSRKKKEKNKSASFVKGNFFKILSLDTFFRGFIESFLLSIGLRQLADLLMLNCT